MCGERSECYIYMCVFSMQERDQIIFLSLVVRVLFVNVAVGERGQSPCHLPHLSSLTWLIISDKYVTCQFPALIYP